MWKPLLLTVLLCGVGACAAQQGAPEDQAARERAASHRVVLVNQTSSQAKYNYTRYISPETQRNNIPTDPQREPAMTLSLGVAFSELSPGGTTLLDVIPGSGLTIVYQQNGQERRYEAPVQADVQLTIGPDGVQPSELPNNIPSSP
ncbi:MAG: hypothetical protein ACO1RX_17515 [Candidatus Sericytochromatia bacterium]